MFKRITIALAGNPNSGKTTIFNNLTGAHQHVGNYPGVTVEKKEGTCKCHDFEIHVVDLPGTYSLTAYSMEEIVARNFIIEERPDVVVDILDASNLERNLYLATQFMELGVPLVLVFNMSDVARARGVEFDLDKLSELLGAPIVSTVGNKGRGMEEILEAIVLVASEKFNKHDVRIGYGLELDNEIRAIQKVIEEKKKEQCEKYGSRWAAIKLLENDSEVRKLFNSTDVLAMLDERSSHLEKIFGDPPEIILADRRYGFISGACQKTVRSTIESRYTMSEYVDTVLTNRVFGIPIFLGLMYLVFHLTFILGDPPRGCIENIFIWLRSSITNLWPAGSDSALKSLFIDGIIGGVGGVIVFLPNIMILFLAISILEDSGYMARAAFITDRIMHKIGLHGKSFIPMLIGFGCTIPAIMATRTLENEKDRLTTIMVAPYMSCGARLPIYTLIIPAFFPKSMQAPMLWTIYTIGIVFAIAGARVIRSSLFKGQCTPFVMELPPYRLPTLRGIFIHMWERSSLYLKKAGTTILGVSIILWAATSYPKKSNYNYDYQALVAQAESIYHQQLRTLNRYLRLPPDSELLQNTIIQKDYHGTNNTLFTFLEIKEKILEVRKRFRAVVETKGLEEGSPEYNALKNGLDKALAQIKARNPRIYPAEIRYIDKIKPAYERRLTEIENEKTSEEMAYSVAGRIGHILEPLLCPMGFDWRIGTALIGAFAAKEVFVAQMGIVYSVGKADKGAERLREQLQKHYDPLIGFCIMIFCLLTFPCMATIAITRQETNSWKWAIAQLVGFTVIAWIVTSVVYQLGTLLKIGLG